MNGKPGDALPGYMIELAHKSFTHVDYKLMPWLRAVEEVRKGNIDCVVGAELRDVPNFALPEEHWGITQIGIYVRSDDDWVYNGFDSLLSKRVGVLKGYTYGEEIDNKLSHYPNVFIAIAGANGQQRNIKQLISGRIDAFIASTPVAMAYIRQLGLNNRIKNAGNFAQSLPLYLACTPGKASTQQLVKQVDETTRRLRASGELEAILNKYGLSDWK